MNEEKIKETVCRYLIGNSAELVGSMPDDKNYLILQRKQSERYKGGHAQFYRGTPPDILGHLIEREKFFGHGVEHQPVRAMHRYNAHIQRALNPDRPIQSGELGFRLEEDLDGRLIISPKMVTPKAYLDSLRTRETFITYAERIGPPLKTPEMITAIDHLFQPRTIGAIL